MVGIGILYLTRMASRVSILDKPPRGQALPGIKKVGSFGVMDVVKEGWVGDDEIRTAFWQTGFIGTPA